MLLRIMRCFPHAMTKTISPPCGQLLIVLCTKTKHVTKTQFYTSTKHTQLWNMLHTNRLTAMVVVHVVLFKKKYAN